MTKFPTRALTTWSLVLVYLLVTGAGWAGIPCCGVNWGCGLDQAACSGCNHGFDSTTKGNQSHLNSRENNASISCACNCLPNSIQGINAIPKLTSVMRVSDEMGLSACATPSLTTLSTVAPLHGPSIPLGPNEFNPRLTYLRTVYLTC
ncbi:MAG: hypothetical protein M1511_03060 [Deltaproteobacteria bacterium]|nr:hypothetical protein [Deltaproteobacteria bacterium]